MFDYSKVDEAVRRIVDATHPRMITIFGSVSRREARDDSDLDILVVSMRSRTRRCSMRPSPGSSSVSDCRSIS